MKWLEKLVAQYSMMKSSMLLDWRRDGMKAATSKLEHEETVNGSVEKFIQELRSSIARLHRQKKRRNKVLIRRISTQG